MPWYNLLAEGMLYHLRQKKERDRMKRPFKTPRRANQRGGGELFSSGETVMLHGDRRVTVRGCRRILGYSPREIRLQMKHRRVIVRGEGLICSCFSGGCTTLQGLICGVELEGGDGA